MAKRKWAIIGSKPSLAKSQSIGVEVDRISKGKVTY